ncbi:unnamed protein product, partial [Urochloa humidicola]
AAHHPNPISHPPFSHAAARGDLHRRRSFASILRRPVASSAAWTSTSSRPVASCEVWRDGRPPGACDGRPAGARDGQPAGVRATGGRPAGARVGCFPPHARPDAAACFPPRARPDTAKLLLPPRSADAEDCEAEETGKSDGDAIGNEGNNGDSIANEGATSSASKTSRIGRINNSKKTNKRARTDVDPLVAAINRGSNKIAKAIKEVGKSDKDVPSDLFANLMDFKGSFNETHLSFYYAHLVSEPHIARAFNSLPFDHKLNWVAKYIAENFPGQ